MKKILLLNIFILTCITGFSQIPAGYYDSASGLGGDGLKTALYNIIKGHTEYEYTADTTDVWDILKETDKDPDNSANVILLYTGESVNAAQEWNNGNGWSREHVWSKSHGQFDPEVYGPGAGTDVHHLRPSDPAANTAKNNRWFADGGTEYLSTGCYYDDLLWTWEPRDEVKGDVARMMFYMATRYEGENNEPDLELINYFPADHNTHDPVYALLNDLLSWNQSDPVDDWERNRNDTIYYNYQHNRNPFIDHPEWVECIWNNNCTGLWFTSYPVKTATDRISYSYAVSASCSMDSVLTISCDSVPPTWLTFSSLTSELRSATASLTGSPALSDTGTYTIYLKLKNGLDSISQIFDITVSDGNPIAFTSNPVTDAVTNELYTYNITVSGDAGANFTLTGTELPAWLNLTENTGATAILTGTPYVTGIDNVILTVTDDTKKTITQEFDINITAQEDANRIIISQYYEGLSNDKYIELTNVGNTDVDLSTYYLGRWSTTDLPAGPYANGDALSGTINAGQTLIYENASAVNPAYAHSSAYASTSATYYNGDDPIALLRSGNTWEDRVDCIYASIAGGKWGLDKGFYRKPDVTAGNKNMSVLDGTGEWTEITIEQADTAIYGTSEYLGSHVFNTTYIKNSDNDFKIYPNPATHFIHFESSNKIQKTEILTLTGSTVIRYSGNSRFVNIANLKSGLYILKLTDTSGKVSFSKFVKH